MGLEDTEERLRGRYRELRQDRGILPIFGLEHGLDAEQLKDLAFRFGRSIRSGQGRATFKRFPLCLISFSSEIGYSYHGTGTDFWPVFDSRLSASCSTVEREQHTVCFRRAHDEWGLKKPVDSAWTRNFGHIAWPIANAVAAREIHRPLAISVRRAITYSSSKATIDELVSRLLVDARSRQSSRIVEWLQDTAVAEALLARALDIPLAEEQIDVSSLDRIIADLESDPVARTLLETASSRRASSPKILAPLAPFKFSMSTRDGTGISLGLVMPYIPEDRLEALSGRLARVGGRLTLEGGLPIETASLVSGSSIKVSESYYTGLVSGQINFPGSPDGDTSLNDDLSQLRPHVSDPMVFAEQPVAGEFVQLVPGSRYSSTRRIFAVSRSSPTEGPWLEARFETEHLKIFEVDPQTPEGRRWLLDADLLPAEEEAFKLVGGLKISDSLKGSVYSRGLPVAVLRSDNAASDQWQISAGPGERQSLSPDDAGVILESGEGKQSLEVRAGQRTESLELDFVEPDRSNLPIDVSLDPPEPAVEDLLRGQVTAKVVSPAILHDIPVRISVESEGEAQVVSEGMLSKIPSLTDEMAALVDDVARKVSDADPTRNRKLALEIVLGHSWRKRWQLNWEPVPVEWTSIEGKWFAFNEDQQLEFDCYRSSSPLEIEARDSIAIEQEDFCLVVPKESKASLYLGAFCFGPRNLELGGLLPELPDAATRASHGSGDLVGFDTVLPAYVSWSTGRPESPIANLASRTVARSIESLFVEQLCGRSWRVIEEKCRLSGGDIYGSLAAVAIEKEMAISGELPDLPPQIRNDFADLLERHMRDGWADLHQAGDDMDPEKFAEKMDYAVTGTYEQLAERVPEERAEEFADVDVYWPPEKWSEALRTAHERLDGSLLANMILPAARGIGLREWDYREPLSALIELLQELHADPNPQGQAKWLGTQELQDSVFLWVDPSQLTKRENWQTSVRKLLQDRQSARATRYAAMRFAAAREGSSV